MVFSRRECRKSQESAERARSGQVVVNAGRNNKKINPDISDFLLLSSWWSISKLGPILIWQSNRLICNGFHMLPAILDMFDAIVRSCKGIAPSAQSS